jgi:predicted alpha/beta superfamily hydrolase
MLLAWLVAAPAAAVPVRFEVRAPASTPEGASLYIAGNVPELGPWDPGKQVLEALGERKYAVTLDLPAGTALEYKVTRGTWDTVEKGAHGEEIGNRRLLVPPQGEMRIEIEVATWRDQVEGGGAPRAHTLSGDVRHLGRIRSTGLDNERDVWVWLPPSYATAPERRYPVIYFHDGQNVFDAATSFIGIEWGADETLGRLIEAGEMREAIAVAVANTPERVLEYTQVLDAERAQGGDADLYLRFLVTELKPRIDAEFRTLPGREDTALIGSSLGGLVSLYAGVAAWETFGLIGGVSPVLHWGGRDLEKRYEAAPPTQQPLRIWIDMGTLEDPASRGRPIQELRRFRMLLERRGYVEGQTVRYREDEGAVHNEAAWAERLPDILRFLLPAVGPKG